MIKLIVPISYNHPMPDRVRKEYRNAIYGLLRNIYDDRPLDEGLNAALVPHRYGQELNQQARNYCISWALLLKDVDIYGTLYIWLESVRNPDDRDLEDFMAKLPEGRMVVLADMLEQVAERLERAGRVMDSV